MSGLKVPRPLKLVLGLPWLATVIAAILWNPWPLILLSAWQMSDFLGAEEM